MKNLVISSRAFKNNDYMPKKHTGFGEDVSPEFRLDNLSDAAVSIAIVMDDLDIPCIKEYNHWLIWNIPKADEISENISYGEMVPELGNAMQGIGYGKHRYRGPKQPVFVRSMHRYIFHFYVLDCFLDLDSRSKKRDLLSAIENHIIQYGNITGKYKRGRKEELL